MSQPVRKISFVFLVDARLYHSVLVNLLLIRGKLAIQNKYKVICKHIQLYETQYFMTREKGRDKHYSQIELVVGRVVMCIYLIIDSCVGQFLSLRLSSIFCSS